MKINKFNEKHEELDVAEMLSEKFFEKSENFGSEKIYEASFFVELTFYFIQLNIYDMEIILESKDYIKDFINFYIHNGNLNIELKINLSKEQHDKLKEKLELDRTANKYNI